MLLALIQLLAVGGLLVLAIIFTVMAIVRWRRKKRFTVLASMGGLTMVLALGIWSFDLFEAETTDRHESVEAFRSDFGFDPPPEVEEIMVKNITIYDACGHWLAFTYVPRVFDAIVEYDQPLQVAYANTAEFNAIVKEVYLNNANTPDWGASPQGRASKILFKKDILQHSFSEYYLWVDSTESMVHLHVSYFD